MSEALNRGPESRISRMARRSEAAHAVVSQLRKDMGGLDEEGRAHMIRELTSRLAGLLATEESISHKLRVVRDQRRTTELSLVLLDEERRRASGLGK